MSLKNRLIGAGIVLSAVGYIGYLAVNHVVNSVKDEARKLEEEKAAELEKTEEAAEEVPEEAGEDVTESDFVDEDTPVPDPA